MKHFFSIILASSLLLTGCEKEIEIDYRSVDKLYVIEGRITGETTEVIVTHTRDMGSPVKGSGIEVTSVEISTNDGFTEKLEYQSDGFYRSPSGLTGNPLQTYTLSVSMDGKEYISSSTMQKQAGIESMKFQWFDVMDERGLICVLGVNDIAGEENHYCYRMYRNGELYRWNTLRDRGKDGETISINIFCMSESMAQDNKEDDRDEILYEGDEITIELRTIDKKAYDYLYSLGLSERTSFNPIDDFSGECLGYFSAYSVVRQQIVFRYSEIH